VSLASRQFDGADLTLGMQSRGVLCLPAGTRFASVR